MKEILHTVINVGIEKPIRLLQITDVHLTYYSESDPPSQIALLKERYHVFRKEGDEPPLDPAAYLQEALALAKELDATLAVTGDVIDLHSAGNVAALQSLLADESILFTPGGHEFQRVCVRTMEEEPPYAFTMHERLAACLAPRNIDFESRVIGGVNILMVNNAFDYFSEATVHRFEEELSRGLPVFVFMHDPVHDKMLCLTESYHPNVRLTKEDYARSARMREALLHDNRVKATFAGHWHKNAETVIDGKRHYVTHGLFAGVCRLIEIR